MSRLTRRGFIQAGAAGAAGFWVGSQLLAEDKQPGPNDRLRVAMAGVIGPVREGHGWVGVSYGGLDRPKDTPPVPEGLDWDLWLGPAPQRPYSPEYVPFKWRAWWDFGGGSLADMACHHMDLPFWALKLRHPTKISAEGPTPHPETAAKRLIVHYEFSARGDLPPVQLTWYDGRNR